ncbi:hypothetical protein JKP88DRAFT_265032, partial [Tribonema minus]
MRGKQRKSTTALAVLSLLQLQQCACTAAAHAGRRSRVHLVSHPRSRAPVLALRGGSNTSAATETAESETSPASGAVPES